MTTDNIPVDPTDGLDRTSASGRPRPRTRAFASWVLDRILPPRCPLCRQSLSVPNALCPACWLDIPFLTGPLCDRLGLPLPFDAGPGGLSLAATTNPPPYTRARAVAAHDGAMRRLIHQFKYSDREDVSALLGRLICGPATAPLLADAQVIIPVPLAWRRLVWRRFNQSAHLAQALAIHSGKPVLVDGLMRRAKIRPQVGLDRQERLTNVISAFAVPKHQSPRIAGKRVLLVDDVITTGATITAASTALLKGGAAQVEVAALAMVTDAPRA